MALLGMPGQIGFVELDHVGLEVRHLLGQHVGQRMGECGDVAACAGRSG